MEVLNKTNMKWYIVRTANNREKSVSEKIIREGELGLLGKIGQVVVPIEKTMTIKSGKRIEKESIMFPGYVFVETSAVGDMKYFLRGLTGTSGFLTTRNGEVESLTNAEVDRMLGKQKEVVNSEVLESFFMIDEEVVITDGPFNTMKATIDDIKDQKVTLSVSIFGRKTPLVLDLNQIAKTH